MRGVPTPKPLQLNAVYRSTNWDLFQQTWRNYEIVTGLVDKPKPQRLSTLLSVIGQDDLIVYNAFYWSPVEEKTVEAVMRKFEKYCKPMRNVIYKRFLFVSRRQNTSESITDFVVALRNLVKNCEYGQLTDSLIRDAIVMGITDKKLEKLC